MQLFPQACPAFWIFAYIPLFQHSSFASVFFSALIITEKKSLLLMKANLNLPDHQKQNGGGRKENEES